MISAYVFAGELSRTASQKQEAFQRYEQQLRRFIADKQKAAVQLASSFAPKTQLGIFFRNQVTKAFKLPLVAKLAIGRSLFDRIDLPDYPVSVGVVPRTQ